MGQGDFKKDEFDKDELAALGEAEETAPDAGKDEQKPDEGPDTQTKEGDEEKPDEKVETEQKAEPTAEEQAAAEAQGFRVETDEKGHTFIIDEDGTKIPPERFKKIYWEAQEGKKAQEKLDLFKKLGPEGYYQVYPDERPAAPQQRQQPILPVQDIGALKVVHPDGPYDGMTLREVYDVDPVFATNLQNEFLYNQRKRTEEEASRAERVRQDSARELEDFGASIGQAAFGKTPDKLSKEEVAQIGETIQTVITWMNTTRRGGGVLMDAYFLMNKEGLLKQVASHAADKTIKDLAQRKGPASIDTSGGGGNGKDTGWTAYEKMTESALTTKIDGMTDKEAAKFFKEAPKSLRTKHPSLPWG